MLHEFYNKTNTLLVKGFCYLNHTKLFIPIQMRDNLLI